jgi:NAD(P)H-dependent flavin oxidoreductase YrpB (nitropropane dioxygenase family)
MGTVGRVELAAAVADAGGLGMLGVGPSPEVLSEEIDRLGAVTQGAFGVNFLMPFLTDPSVVDLVATKVRVVEFFYGEPDADLVRRGHHGGALVAWQIGSVDEALQATDAGVDFVIAQGTEAGGHVRGAERLSDLLPSVVDAVGVPIVAAGGIAKASAMAAALRTGASAVRVGTRFVATVEAGAHSAYKQALVDAGPGDTVLTEAFSVGWADAPHRVLRSCVDAAGKDERDAVGETAFYGERMPVPRFAVMPPDPSTEGSIDAMALYAGEGVAHVNGIERAADIVAELATGTEALLKR